MSESLQNVESIADQAKMGVSSGEEYSKYAGTMMIKEVALKSSLWGPYFMPWRGNDLGRKAMYLGQQWWTKRV